MKKIFAIVFIMMANSGFCQDNIIFKNGDEVNGKVLEITAATIKVKSADNPDGPVYIYKKSELMMIHYANGKNEIFTDRIHRRYYPPKIYFISDTSFKPRNRVISYLFRAGYEYAHEEEINYYWMYGGVPFFYTENSFYAEALIGTRGRYYQYATGLGAYFQNFDYTDFSNYNLLFKKAREQSITLQLTFSNRIYFSEKKTAPFIMVDASLAFANVIRINNNPDFGNYYNSDTRWDYLMGGGVELKTKSKYKLQFEIGFRKRTDWNFPSKLALFHSGICLLY